MLSFNIPFREEIRNKVIEAFNIHPCEFQITNAIAQLQCKEVVTISPTGSGKTLTFWIPLLFNDDGIIIVITALNILGAQNVIELAKLGLPAVNITGCTHIWPGGQLGRSFTCDQPNKCKLQVVLVLKKITISKCGYKIIRLTSVRLGRSL
jgi:hypothetical protein